MRPIYWISLGILLGGCKSASHPPTPTTDPAAMLSPPSMSIAATALVFDPPIAAGEPVLDLDRGARAPVAFVGFDQLTTTFFYLRTDDKQRFDNFSTGDRFERRAVSERFGVSYR